MVRPAKNSSPQCPKHQKSRRAQGKRSTPGTLDLQGRGRWDGQWHKKRCIDVGTRNEPEKVHVKPASCENGFRAGAYRDRGTSLEKKLPKPHRRKGFTKIGSALAVLRVPTGHKRGQSTCVNHQQGGRGATKPSRTTQTHQRTKKLKGTKHNPPKLHEKQIHHRRETSG